MPHYHVQGVTRDKGIAISKTVEAASEDEAVRHAGFVVSGVELARPKKAKPASEPRQTFYAMVVAATILKIMAVLYAVALGLLILFALAGAGQGYNAAALVLGAMVGLVVPVFIYAAGEALEALRVIAINSYRA